MSKLRKVFLNGFKSFRYEARLIRDSVQANPQVHQGKAIDFGDVTVLLGPNGAGKSNIVSFFKMLGFMMTGTFQDYVQDQGTSDSLLHFGRQVTPTMQAEIEFERFEAHSTYLFTLADAAPDTLICTNEAVIYSRKGYPQPQNIVLGSGHRESRLKESLDKTCRVICGMLSGCRVYQFHDTSQTAKVRKSGYIEDAAYLRSEAGNLAAYLRAMRESHRKYYDRIIETVRLVFPQFGDFVLEPSPRNDQYILLNWREKKRSDYLFGPHQLSDGTLRFMALATLFLQPPERLPAVIVIDEPELGLHPFAISVLAGMIRNAAAKCQVILSTQSTRLTDEFSVDQIVVVEHDDKDDCTRCHRPDAETLKDWIARYSTSELWEKNVFGGRP